MIIEFNQHRNCNINLIQKVAAVINISINDLKIEQDSDIINSGQKEFTVIQAEINESIK